jgi:hypothetical protein
VSTKSHDSPLSIGLGYGLTIVVLRFYSRQGLGIFLFTTESRPVPGPNQHPIQCVQGALSLGIKRPAREANHTSI